MNLIKISDSDHVQGLANAPITLVEYADFECSYCGHAYSIIKEIQKRLGDKLRFVFRNYPLSQLHRHAVAAAVASEAAASQGKFWEMHDILFENQRHLHESDLIMYAEKIGLDVERFKKDFSNEAMIKKVNTNIESGNKLGVQGTPTFFVNGKFYDGDWTTYEFPKYLESLV